MPEMYHEIQVQAPPEKVYQAIATREGLRSWWTSDTVAEPRVGSVAEFGFHSRAGVFRMRVEELQPGRRVVWACLGDPDEWRGTRLTWELSAKNGGTLLRFVHAGWCSTGGIFATCNSTWGELMYRLKNYAEGKAPGPHWTK